MRRTVLISLTAIIALGAVSEAGAATFSWLSFLPKAEREKASSLVASADAAFVSIAADRARAVSAERSYAGTAQVLAEALDRYAENHDALTFALSNAGLGGTSAGNAVSSLADTRRLRWEVSRDIASSRYGHAGTKGFVTAESEENGILRSGTALKAILSKRIQAIPKTRLLAAAKAMEDRIAAHPDCPATAFSDLRAAAAKLPTAQYRSWVLSLTALLPGPLASEDAVSLDSTEAAEAFMSAKRGFADAYAVRMTLKEALPAAAAAGWYVDGYAVSMGSDGYARVSPQALATFASFLRNLAVADPAMVTACLVEDDYLSSAFAECSAFAWVAEGRAASRFTTDVGLDAASFRNALRVAWRATAAPPSETPPVIDREAVYRAEAFASRIEDQKDGAGVLSVYVELRRDPPAFEAVRLGGRYARVRERLDAVFSESLSSLAGPIRTKAEKAQAAPSSSRAASADQRMDAADEGFRLLTSGGDPFSVVVLAGAFDRQVGGVSMPIAVPPSVIAEALAPLSSLIESGALVVSLPCFVVGAKPSADELALLSAGLGWIGSGEGVASAWLGRLCARNGIPLPFVLPSIRSSAARRFADLSSTAVRFALNYGGENQ